jgi:3-hydroxybutyryl-CoA dehydrogenase
MQIVIIADEPLRQELLSNGLADGVEIVWKDSESFLYDHTYADAIIDLLFVNDTERIQTLKQCLPKLIVINSVQNNLLETDPAFVRINGWPTFLNSNLIEASFRNEELKQKAEELFSLFNKKFEWLPDEAGFITPRVVSNIINEAFLSLEEGVSTKDDINTAMKLGTAYPYGPFEWAEKIGVQNIVTLLEKLSKKQSRYKPAELLVQETNKAI